jgi:small subunit ribosomal protein S8
MLNDPLANAFSKIMNAELAGKTECLLRPASKMLLKLLEMMQASSYIGEFKVIEDKKGNVIKLNLIGKINKGTVIKPRYAVKKNEFEKFEKRYLPAKDFGIIFVSTSKGIMNHKEAKEKGLGGRLIAYIY